MLPPTPNGRFYRRGPQGIVEAVSEWGDEVEAAANALRLAEQSMWRIVRDARAAGTTWTAIGDALHVSPQAAQQRFGRRVTWA